MAHFEESLFMSNSAIMLGLLGLALLSYALYNLLLHPLSHIPGPLGVRLGLWSWTSTRAVKLDMGWKLLKLHEEYGTVVRIAQNEASVCDPAAIEQIYRFKSPLEKTRFYESLCGVNGPTMLSTVDNRKHAEFRRAELPAYAPKFLADFEQPVEACSSELTDYLDRCIDAGKGKGTLDLGQVMQVFAVDVIGKIALDKSFSFSTFGEDTQNVLPLLNKFLELACLDGTQPTIASFFRRVMQMLPEPAGIKMLSETVRARIQARLQEYEEQGSQSSHHDMLEKLMAVHNLNNSEYSLEQIRAAVGLILGAGSDTTAITMRALIRFVVGDPRIYSRLQEEIDQAANSGTISFPLVYSNASKLPYFQACLKETLRLHPAVPWPLPRKVGHGGALIAGRFFAEGTELSMSPFVVQRRAEAYEDAAVFRPERWTDADEAQRKRMEHCLLAFGAGPRVCAGKAIGMMEVSKVVPLLFWRYRIAFTPWSATSPHAHKFGRAVDGETSFTEPYFVTSQWVAVQKDFWCDVTRRAVRES